MDSESSAGESRGRYEGRKDESEDGMESTTRIRDRNACHLYREARMSQEAKQWKGRAPSSPVPVGM